MLKILDDKNKMLRTVCEEVKKPYSAEDFSTLKEMVGFLSLSQDPEYAEKNHLQAGIGLAAPQIGLAKRMFAIYLTENDVLYKYGLINPTILRTSLKQAYMSGGEGCLSVKEKHLGLVMRYYKVVMAGYDVFEQKDITITAYGYLAIALQHEFDHLNGVLYYDHIDKKDPLKVSLGAVEI
ncbi:MAG: peptide deformylase [Bacilli bacterium]|jgi:peptide deformylase|nr:peptide deformylase [Bacilli bacterium]